MGERGTIDKRNAANIETISNLCGIKAIQKLKRALSKIALLGSYRVYIARKSQDWNPGSLIEVSEHEERVKNVNMQQIENPQLTFQISTFQPSTSNNFMLLISVFMFAPNQNLVYFFSFF